MKQKNTKTWFITGASSGFGRAFAEYALDQGYNVVASSRNISKLNSLVKKNPEKVLAVKLDVTKSEDIQPAIDEAINKFKTIDVLINNAGYGTVGAVEETPEKELRAQMETNFFGAVAITQKILPILREQNYGAIVNISSMGGIMSFGGFGAYSASKFALEGLSEALHQEMQAFGIKVMIVEPGAFRTDFAGDALKHMPKIDAYKDVTGEIRAFAKGMDGTQEGDPNKAAEAIDIALNSGSTPLRLQLGEDSVSAVRKHTEDLLKSIAEWENLALSTIIKEKEVVA